MSTDWVFALGLAVLILVLFAPGAMALDSLVGLFIYGRVKPKITVLRKEGARHTVAVLMGFQNPVVAAEPGIAARLHKSFNVMLVHYPPRGMSDRRIHRAINHALWWHGLSETTLSFFGGSMGGMASAKVIARMYRSVALWVLDGSPSRLADVKGEKIRFWLPILPWLTFGGGGPLATYIKAAIWRRHLLPITAEDCEEGVCTTTVRRHMLGMAKNPAPSTVWQGWFISRFRMAAGLLEGRVWQAIYIANPEPNDDCRVFAGNAIDGWREVLGTTPLETAIDPLRPPNSHNNVCQRPEFVARLFEERLAEFDNALVAA